MKNSYSTLEIPELQKTENDKYVSYSQYSKWKKCPRSWKLAYVDGIKKYEPGIHAVFGTAMHECIQYWIKVLYTETVKASDAIDFESLLKAEIKKTYAKEYERYGYTHFSTSEELVEFYTDGLQILNWLRKKRKRYFDQRNEELVGIEIPLLLNPDPKVPNVKLNGFLDLVIKEKSSGMYIIRDIKTSTRGWGDREKKDTTKISQLLLYKIYFSQQYNIPLDKIKVEYLIVRRKVDEDAAFPIRRVQNFQPAQGSVSINKVQRDFNDFLETCFKSDGSYNLESDFPTTPGIAFTNCRFCEYNNETDCPLSKRT